MCFGRRRWSATRPQNSSAISCTSPPTTARAIASPHLASGRNTHNTRAQKMGWVKNLQLIGEELQSSAVYHIIGNVLHPKEKGVRISATSFVTRRPNENEGASITRRPACIGRETYARTPLNIRSSSSPAARATWLQVSSCHSLSTPYIRIAKAPTHLLRRRGTPTSRLRTLAL